MIDVVNNWKTTLCLVRPLFHSDRKLLIDKSKRNKERLIRGEKKIGERNYPETECASLGEAQIEFRVLESLGLAEHRASVRDDADPDLKFPSLDVDDGVGSGGSLHSSSTSPPPASRRSSIRGAPPLPRTCQ